MNRRKYVPLFTAALAICLLALGTLRTQAQDPPRPRTEQGVIQEPVPATIDPELIQSSRRPAIPFRAWMMIHPITKQPIPPDTVVILPNAKRPLARQYFADLNRFERALNEMGFSLRDSAERTTLQTLALDRERLAKEEEILRQAHQGIDLETMLPPVTPTRMRQAYLQSLKETSQRLREVRKLSAAPAVSKSLFSKSYNLSYGNPAAISASLSGNMSLTGSGSTLEFKGGGQFKGAIFNVGANLAGLNLSLTAPDSDNMVADLEATVLNTKILDASIQQPTSFSRTFTASKSYDFSTTTRFSLGPIPMTAKVGARGSAFMAFQVNVNRLSVSSHATPAVSANVYLQVGADIVIGGAGASANMTLLRENMDLYGDGKVVVANNQVMLKGNTYGYSDLTALSGKVSAYAYIYVPRWGWPPTEKRTYDFVLWDYPGASFKGYFWNQKDLSVDP